MNRETPVELFRKACGLGSPITLANRPAHSAAGEPSTLDSPQPFVLIGRSPKTDLSLSDDLVSRRHAYLQAVAGGVFAIDLESRTKTFWDDEPEARASGWLEPGQSLRIGPYRIERMDQPADEASHHDPFHPLLPPEDPGVPWNAFPRPIFELPFRLGGVASTWEMAGLLGLVGRDDHCQFVLSDDSISQSHACLVRTSVGTWVVDLATREGVFVNGTRVRWAWLGDGDLLRLGRFTLVVRYDRQPEGIRRDDVPLEAGARTSTPPGDDPRDDLGTIGGGGRGLALRPPARPPGPRKPSVPSRHSRPAEPAIVDRGEWEPVLGTGGPSPYALWQQQMQLMESFHNDMTMMVQMFIAMHREFQSSVRDELARVQKLTKELSRLNARLLEVPESPGAGRALQAVRPAPKGGPAPPESQPARGANGHPGAGRRADEPKSGERGRQPRPSDRPSSIPTNRKVAGDVSPPRQDSIAMYADITRRITEIQRERRGYWQRILKAING